MTTLCSQTTIEWNGDGDGVSWPDADNWDLSRIPMLGDSVVIDGANVADSVFLHGDDAAAKNILLINGAKLSIEAERVLKLGGSLNYAIRTNASSLCNYGEIAILDVGDNEFGDRAFELLNASNWVNNGICNIFQTKGYGIRMESSSTFVNNGSIDILTKDRAPLRVSGSNSIFTNNGGITITEDAGFMRSLWVTQNGQVMNAGTIMITVNGSGAPGVAIETGGSFTNTGALTIVASDGIQAMRMSGNNSLIDLDGGTVDIQLTNADGVKITGGEFAQDITAQVTISGSPVDHLLKVDPPGVLDCQGILDLVGTN